MVRAFFTQVRRVGWIETIRQTGMFLEAVGEWLQTGGTRPVSYWTVINMPRGTIYLEAGGIFRVTGDDATRFQKIIGPDPKYKGRRQCVIMTPRLAAMLVFIQWRARGPMYSRWRYVKGDAP